MNKIDRFRSSLVRSRSGFLDRLNHLIRGGELDFDFYEQLEEILISGDVGVETTLKLVHELKEEAIAQKVTNRESFRSLMIQKISALLAAPPGPAVPTEPPLFILLVGVNGSGKTTSAAKLAGFYKDLGKKVIMVAGDTFRAAATEQLEIWSVRAGVELIRQHSGSDSSALFFDAINAAKARGIDVVIGDTAGRLHNKYNLMEELNKIYRVIGRNLPGAPHQVILVVDATTGQNAVAQARSFNQALPLSGLILTKLDGTARGGIVLAIKDLLDLPVLYIGTGEQLEDFAPFDAETFTAALFE
ncbi:MAG: signal recognition particle-docking protein FtsY [Firmicutes bacterium]|nr:signal recognition particle-docking protein FtsY [Bacillota bacterium]